MAAGRRNTADSANNDIDAIITQINKACESTNGIIGLILMGSHAAGDNAIGSDIDLLAIIDPSVNEQLHIEVVGQLINTSFEEREILLKVNADGKTIVYLKHPHFLKIDLGYTNDPQEKARYLHGSETARVLFEDTSKCIGPNLVEQLSLIMATKAHQSLPEYQKPSNEAKFLEWFELCCKSAVRGDAYRVEFYGFLLKHILVVLELIDEGETTHLYLPKMAYERAKMAKKCVSLRLDDGKFRKNLQEYADLFLNLCGELCDKGQFQRYFDAVFAFYFP